MAVRDPKTGRFISNEKLRQAEVLLSAAYEIGYDHGHQDAEDEILSAPRPSLLYRAWRRLNTDPVAQLVALTLACWWLVNSIISLR